MAAEVVSVAESKIKIVECSTETLSFGGISGVLIRYGRLRFVRCYATTSVSVNTWSNVLSAEDRPTEEVSVTAWLPDSTSSFASCKLTFNTNGSVNLNHAVYRGGWFTVWLI